jgi:hypothetical protein
MGNRTESPTARGRPRPWLLYFIATSAAVAIWSGWVGLGGLCGFGVIHPLPGIIPGFRLNMAITLPVSVEAYGAYALGAWMAPGTPEDARTFAKWSAFAALAYGAAGQVTYHLLVAHHAAAAPWWVVMAVSCMPVAVLAAAAALTHMLRAPATGTVSAAPFTDAQTAAADALRRTLAAGNPLSQNQMQAQFRLSRAEAQIVRQRVGAGSNGNGAHG